MGCGYFWFIFMVLCGWGLMAWLLVSTLPAPLDPESFFTLVQDICTSSALRVMCDFLLVVTASYLFLPRGAPPLLPQAPPMRPCLRGLDVPQHLACVLFLFLAKPFFKLSASEC